MMWKMYQFWILFGLAIISWSIFCLIINNVSPLESPQIGFPLFYFSFFFSLTFSFSVICSLCWKALIPVKSSYLCILSGIREGFFIGLGGLILLFFLQGNVFHWIQIPIIFFFIALIEFIIEK